MSDLEMSVARTLLYMIRERPDAVDTIQDVFQLEREEAELLLESARDAFQHPAYRRTFLQGMSRHPV